MFTTFGMQYAGYIDMAHVGYDGIPANDRWFPNERLIEVFANARALAHPTPDTMALLPQVEESVQQRNWLCGTPDEAITFLQELEAKYPAVERVLLSFAMGTPQAVCQEQLTRFAEEVMPAFARRTP